MVIDAADAAFYARPKAVRSECEMARRGKVLPGLLEALLRDKYF